MIINDMPMRGGANVTIDGSPVTESLALVSGSMPVVQLPNVGYSSGVGKAVVYNGDLHVFGGTSTGNTNHYKWDGSTWAQVSSLPYGLMAGYGSVCVHNNELYYLHTQGLYKLSGSTWSRVATLPSLVDHGAQSSNASVRSPYTASFNGAIHAIFGYTNSTTDFQWKWYYKWDGSAWVYVGQIATQSHCGGFIVLNNELHLITAPENSSYNFIHYKWNGSSLVNVTSTPIVGAGIGMCVFDGKIHVIQGAKHYTFSSGSWVTEEDLSTSFATWALENYNNEMHYFSYGSSYHYVFGKKIYMEA